MNYILYKSIFIVLSITGIVFSNSFNHNQLIIEYLFSSSAESKYQELLSLRALNYKDAKDVIEIQNVISNNTKLDFDSYSEILLSHEIDTKLGEKNLYKNPINNIDLDEWAYIHWLMDNDQSTLLKKLINYIDDLNQIWEPAITGKASKDNTIGYYLHTQFEFSRYLIRTIINEKIGSLKYPEEQYIWLSLFPDIKTEITSLDNVIEDDYFERFVINSINLQLGKKNNLTDIELDLHKSQMNPNKLLKHVQLLDSLINDYDMQSNVWENCECVEEYGIFMMNILLLNLFTSKKYRALTEFKEIDATALALNYFQNSLNRISYDYDIIDHNLFGLYFANNFNNLKKQQPFIIKYLTEFGSKENHKFSLIITSTLREIGSYTHTPTETKP